MKRKRIIIGSVCALLLLGIIFVARFTHIPEPVFEGVQLGIYLSDPQKCDDTVQKKFKALGREAVPYLIDQMKPDLLQEIFAKIHPKLPVRVQKAVPDPLIYQSRRITAAMLLSVLHTKAADCLPVAMELLEKKDPAVKAYCIGLAGLHAPGTVYEERALRFLLAACTYTAPMDREKTRTAIYWLGRNFRRHKDEIIPCSFYRLVTHTWLAVPPVP